MKYLVLIIDGAAGLPLPEHGGKTSLELAVTPNLDAMVKEGSLGLARTVPRGMEPGSAVACMSVLGYDPKEYYEGRASIEAASMDIDIGEGEAVFRCNLVTVDNEGRMQDYSAGHISSAESTKIIKRLNEEFKKEPGGEQVEFHPGVSYRHIFQIKGNENVLKAEWTPPHDISGKPIKEYLPKGKGSRILRKIMKRSEELLKKDPDNKERKARGEPPVTHIWLFWGSGQPRKAMPPFQEIYGLKAALTSGVDLLRGLAKMSGMKTLKIKGVTDGPDSDNVAQVEGALAALKTNDMMVIHIEAPDEAGHGGDVSGKVAAIQKIDAEVVSRLRGYRGDLRVLIMPDHPTPISKRTHTPDPVPFLLWGKGIKSNGAGRFTEAEAKKTGLFIQEGYKIMGQLVGKGC